MTTDTPGSVLAGGRWLADGHLVHWRLGRSASAGAASATAHRWVQEVALAAGLPQWRGLQRDGAYRKPRIVGAGGWDASISHSGELVLVAVVRGAEVGADIEAAPFRAFGSAALRRRMCSPHERAIAEGLDPRRAATYLAQVWTAKEAITKASGDGLAVDFRTLEAGVPAPMGTDAAADDVEVAAEAHLALVGCDGPLLKRLRTA